MNTLYATNFVSTFFLTPKPSNMLYEQIFSEFTRKFVVNYQRSHRGIGIECEIPVVTILGDAVPLSVILKHSLIKKALCQL